jgi:hypothetical protein
LNAETDHDAHNQCHYEHFEESEAFDGAIRIIEDEDYEDIDNADGASGHERDRQEEVESDSCADDLLLLARFEFRGDDEHAYLCNISSYDGRL